MPLSSISNERFDWKPRTIGGAPRGDTLVYDVLSSLPGLLQSGEWANIKLASALTVINVFGNYSAVSAGFTNSITLCIWCVPLFFYVLVIAENVLRVLKAKHQWQQMMTFLIYYCVILRTNTPTRVFESGECSILLIFISTSSCWGCCAICIPNKHRK